MSRLKQYSGEQSNYPWNVDSIICFCVFVFSLLFFIKKNGLRPFPVKASGWPIFPLGVYQWVSYKHPASLKVLISSEVVCLNTCLDIVCWMAAHQCLAFMNLHRHQTRAIVDKVLGNQSNYENHKTKMTNLQLLKKINSPLAKKTGLWWGISNCPNSIILLCQDFFFMKKLEKASPLVIVLCWSEPLGGEHWWGKSGLNKAE